MNPEAVNLTYEPAINEVKVPILPRDVCNDWIDTANVTEGMICAGYPEGGKDACQVSSLLLTNHLPYLLSPLPYYSPPPHAGRLWRTVTVPEPERQGPVVRGGNRVLGRHVCPPEAARRLCECA